MPIRSSCPAEGGALGVTHIKQMREGAGKTRRSSREFTIIGGRSKNVVAPSMRMQVSIHGGLDDQ